MRFYRILLLLSPGLFWPPRAGFDPRRKTSLAGLKYDSSPKESVARTATPASRISPYTLPPGFYVTIQVFKFYSFMVASLAVHTRVGALKQSPHYGLDFEPDSPFPAGGSWASPARATVLIIDDHPIVRAGIIDLLRGHPWLVVVGQAADGRQGIELARQLSPNVIIIDINLPKFNGIATMKALRTERPDSKLLILSMHEPQQFALHLVECGARGYVSKRIASNELIDALETVASGGTWFDSDFSQMLLKAYSRPSAQDESSMSPREREVLVGIAEGLSTKEIAARLDISARTVDTHRGRLTRKLNIRTVAGLTRFALQSGLVPA